MGAKYYLSTDVGAPVIGYSTPGSLIAVLKACLVDGYGSKAPAGWTMPFTGTNQAVFRMGGGGLRYLYINDSPTGGYAAPVRAYDTMSGLTTGTGMFPTAAQVTDTNARWWRAYNTSGTLWAVIATDRYFYLWVGAQYAAIYFFGDPNKLDPSDSYNTILCVSATASGLTSSQGIGRTQLDLSSFNSGLFAARSLDQANTSWANVGLNIDTVKNGGNAIGSGGLSYPNQADGSIYMGDVWVHESNITIYLRGVMPELYCPFNGIGTPDFSNFNVITIPSGELSGRSFLVVAPAVQSNGCALFDVTV